MLKKRGNILNVPSKEYYGRPLETEIIMAVDAAAYEDAAWLDALAEEVNKEIDDSEIATEWDEFKHAAQSPTA